ncbi:hypothetical protein HPP92_008864 [Vanilla planifolia]|uniref:Uncharacterized protein n=1 Tax=Vanilla planifolia TaxID=51239 RepID=A0A835R974_VANPL|nr:hypothetical protein HPP92_008864 [Vanilla planifolia]
MVFPEMAMKAPISGTSPPLYFGPPLKTVLVRFPTFRTSFFNGGVVRLKAARIQTANYNAKCVGHNGGALTVRMNLFDRLARVIKSYANAILSNVEDPEKILDQAVLEMNDDLTKMRQATAQVLASKKIGEQI